MAPEIQTRQSRLLDRPHSFVTPGAPALILAPMEGVTDFPMRALLTQRGGFSFCVSEFIRISQNAPSVRSFRARIPELGKMSQTAAGTPVQIQLLGGDPDKMAKSAINAWRAGAQSIDLNFGCPAPLVNKHDGGACLLQHPKRLFSIIAAVRAELPPQVPLSAKLRLGWENPEDIYENAIQAEKAGAQWITIHARTKAQGYRPPAHWHHIGKVRKLLSIPIVANGDIWTMEDFLRCRETTGCDHFMIGRGALANPALPLRIASCLGVAGRGGFAQQPSHLENFEHTPKGWKSILTQFSSLCESATPNRNYAACRIKQWLSMAAARYPADWITLIKKARSLDEIFSALNEQP